MCSGFAFWLDHMKMRDSPSFFFFFRKATKAPLIYSFIGCGGSLTLPEGISHCGELRLLSSYSVQGHSLCGGFPGFGAWALGVQASVVAAHRLNNCGAHGLGCLRHVGCLPGPGIKLLSLAHLTRQILYHWTTRVVWELGILTHCITRLFGGLSLSNCISNQMISSTSAHPSGPLLEKPSVPSLFYCRNCSVQEWKEC